MSNKLVYVDGAPFWMSPEGHFEAAELLNGRVVERIMLRTSHGLRVLGRASFLQD